MTTAVLEQETVTVPVEEVSARLMAASPVKQTRSITVALAFLIGCVALMMIGFAVILPVFPQRLQALGLGPEMLALMEGAFGLGMFLFSTPMGTWAGRIGRKPILFISLAGFIFTNLLLAWVNVPLLFIPIRFVEGMLLSGLFPAAMSMVGDTIPLSKQGRWIGLLTTAQAVGFALGPGLGGLLSQTLGLKQSLPALGRHCARGITAGLLSGARNPASTRASRSEIAQCQAWGTRQQAEGMAFCSPDLARGPVPGHRFRHDLHLPLRVPTVSFLP